MDTKMILAASIAALAVSVSAPSVAATPAQGDSSGSGMTMQSEGMGMSPTTTGGAGSSHTVGGGMMGGGMMGGGSSGSGDMMGMMGSCPMAMGRGLDRKTAMRMHGEMMRAMGDILIKYADKIQEPATKQ